MENSFPRTLFNPFLIFHLYLLGFLNIKYNLLALRTRTLRGIKNDFQGLYTDIKCPLKCGEDDLTKHILECRVVKARHNTSEMCNDDVKYEDVFSRNVLKQKQATELYRQLLDIRDEMLNSQPEAVTGPMH